MTDMHSYTVDISINSRPFSVFVSEQGVGSPVVFLHGSGPGASGLSNFSRNTDHFVQQGFRVVVIDFPGWGKSSPVVLSDMGRTEFNARVLNEVLGALDIDECDIVGNSMGGSSALHFAALYPNKARRLIVMGGGVTRRSLFHASPTEGISRINELYESPSRENLARMLRAFVGDPTTLTDVLIEGRWQAMQASEEHLKNFVASKKAHTGGRDELLSAIPSLNHRVLILWGKEDRFVPLDVGLTLFSLLKDPEMHIFAKCGHWTQWEQSDRFNSISIEFLRS